MKLLLEQKGEDGISLTYLLSHTQGIKRVAKAVTEASSTLYSKSDKAFFIKAQIESRRVMPKFVNKKGFVSI